MEGAKNLFRRERWGGRDRLLGGMGRRKAAAGVDLHRSGRAALGDGGGVDID